MNTTAPTDGASLALTFGGSALGLLIRQARDGLRNRWERELAQAGHNLTFSQYVTIKKLAEDSLPKVTELACNAEVNPGAMTRILDQLESRDLIVRNTDPTDRRALNIRLTDEGRAIWRDIEACGQRVREIAFAGMDESERAQFIRLLELMRNNLTDTDS